MRRVLFPVLLISAGVVIYITIRNEVSPGDVPRETAQIATPALPDNVPPQDPSIESTEKAHRIVKTADGKVEELRGFSPDDIKPLAEHSDAFLQKKGANAYNLLAAFSASGDRRFLNQALEQFPKNPAALYVALADAPKEERASLIERFKTADPNNPLPWIFSAAEMFEDGRPQDAVAELREALKRPGFYTYFNERAAALRELALQSGAGEFGADGIANFTQRLPHLQAAMNAARGLQAYVDEQIANQNAAAIRDSAQLLYGLGQMFQTPEASRLLVGQLVGVSLERRALEVAAKSGENPLPVAAETRSAELDQIRDEARSLGELATRVYAEPALWKGYFARFKTEGELAALRWVQRQPPSVQVPISPKSPAAAVLK